MSKRRFKAKQRALPVMSPREVWDEIERWFIPDNVPRRDEGLSDQRA
jgi:hypothetical protein